MNLSFENIPQKYKTMKEDIKITIIKKLYSIFNFHYLSLQTKEENDKDSIKTFLIEYLNEFKFFTYQISEAQLDDDNILNKTNAIICVEKQCLIIDSIDSDLIFEIINELKASKINISSTTNNSDKTLEEIEAFQEVTNLYDSNNDLKIYINNNLFVKSTFYPIASFVIRRFYYPSIFFKDQTFFSFNAKGNTAEQSFKTNFEHVILSKNNDEFKANFPKFAKYIHDEKNLKKLFNSDKKVEKFREKDFIKIREIHSNRNKVDLVLHIDKLYLFVIKKPIEKSESNMHLHKHEIDFVQNFSHRCLTKFYGFVKEIDYTGLVYEFMSNGNLSEFIAKNKDKINNLFSFIALNRIFQGIYYIHSNSLIYRDLKPLNILIDHNYNVFIADFDTVRNAGQHDNEQFTSDLGSNQYMSPEQYSSNKAYYSSDIFSFGLIIYLLYEKRDLNKPFNNKSFNAPKQIQTLFQGCIKNDPKERITSKYIIKNLFSQMKSFEYLEDFLLNENDQKRLIPLIIRYFMENIICLYQSKKIINIKLHTYYIFSFLDVLIQENNSETLLEIGMLYESGKLVEKDYIKAKKYYELAVEKNNIHGYLALGLLYAGRKDIEKNQHIAFNYYQLAAKQNDWNGLYLMGECYASGEGIEQNIEESQHYFQLAAECNNSSAFYCLGMLYYDGNLVEKNYAKAKYYFELSAGKKDPYGLIMLGNMYNNGNGVVKDHSKAIHYFKLSAKYGFQGAYNNIGNFYYDKKKYARAKYYYELASEIYMPQSLFSLSSIYYSNDKDIAKFKEYIKLAILTDFTPSYYLYGIYYYDKMDYIKAKKYFEIGDEKGDGNSQNTLGCLYRDGLGVNQDFFKAKELFEKSMRNGSLMGIINLGELYYYGNGFKQNFLKAKEIFMIAVQKNYSLGYVYLGNFYYEGLTGEKNYRKAKEYYQKAADQKNPYAFINLAKIYFTGRGATKDFKEAIKNIKLSAKDGIWIALQNLGILYFNGFNFLKKDEKKAFKCFEKSIEDNNSDALLSLGILFYEGKSIKNESKGFEYYQKALKYFGLSAKLKNSFASLNLAKIYIEGKYEKPDYIKALRYIKESIDRYNYYAYIYLGDFYLEGRGVERNYTEAIKNYEKAASHNISEAFLNLGILYYQGKGVDKNYYTAIHYFELSATQKNSEALFKLGKLYYEGKEIKRNYKKSLEYFMLSSENDNLDSYYYIGSIYEKGKGVDINIFKAIQCFQKCIEIHDNDLFLIMKDYNLFTYKYQIYYNYYRAINDLGLIYATNLDYQNINLADKYLKEAFLGEYPLGQNNHGLICQLYFNRINDAEYRFKRASEHDLVFAEFNIGYLKEKEKKFDEMVNHYNLASKYENKPFKFRNQIIDDDEQLEISKSFIVFIANLKLVKYYLTQEVTETNKEKAESYLMKAIFQPLFRLLFQQNNKSYSFQFDLDENNIISNLKDYFFKLPLFFNSINSNWTINDQHNDIKYVTINIQSKKENKENFKIKLNGNHNNDSNRDTSFLNEKIKYILNIMNNEGKFEIIKNDNPKNEIKFKFKNDDIIRYIKYPQNLYEFIFQDIHNIKKEIDDVIVEGMKILYEPPYYILFGRIRNYQDAKQIRKDIDESFYEGFGLL